jgi:serine/threonine-protein kinase SRPK3
LELLGPSVDVVLEDYREAGDCLEPEDILRLSKQLLQAIAFMHGVGCAHGGMWATLVLVESAHFSP